VEGGRWIVEGGLWRVAGGGEWLVIDGGVIAILLALRPVQRLAVLATPASRQNALYACGGSRNNTARNLPTAPSPHYCRGVLCCLGRFHPFGQG